MFFQPVEEFSVPAILLGFGKQTAEPNRRREARYAPRS